MVAFGSNPEEITKMGEFREALISCRISEELERTETRGKTMGTIFSDTLVRLRKENGFKTAYSFYYGNGGAPVLKISYRKYLALEQGRNLPVFGRLRGLLLGLRILPNSHEAQELISAWLRTMAGEADYREVLEPILLLKPNLSPMSPMDKALRKSLTGEKYHVSSAQLAVVAASQVNYLCFLALANDSGAWTPEKLAAHLALPSKDISACLKELKSVKLVKERAGRYKCPLAEKMLEYPHRTPLVEKMLMKLLEYQEELLKTGKPVWRRRGIIRADAGALAGFIPLMKLSLSTVHTFATTRKTRESAIYLIEGRIIKLRDF